MAKIVDYGFGANRDLTIVSAADVRVRIIASSPGIQKHIRSIVVGARPEPFVVWGAHAASDVIVVRQKMPPNANGTDFTNFATLVELALGTQNFKALLDAGATIVLFNQLYLYTWQQLTFAADEVMAADGEVFFVAAQGPIDRDTGASLQSITSLSVNGNTVNTGAQQNITLR